MSPDLARDRFLALHAELAARVEGEPALLSRLRADGLARFQEQGLPHAKQEEWRYTKISRLAEPSFKLPTPGSPVSRQSLEEVCFPVFACSLSVFVDGLHREDLSSSLSREGRVQSLARLAREAPETLAPWLGSLVDGKEHPLAALNGALLEDGAVVRVPAGQDSQPPLHLVMAAAETGPRIRQPRLLVIAEAGSRVQIILDHVSLGGGDGYTNAVTEVFVGPNASVDLVILQREGNDAFHTSNVAASLERDARFSSHVVTLGGHLVRNDLSVRLAGEGSEATLDGLFVGSGRRVVDNHTLVDHAVPHCTSRQLYKGVLGNASRGVFRGRVLVRPDAQQTNAEQNNPNLLLSDAAEVDTKPQLEIHADDVRCSHGSTIGQLEDDALFYLRTRAIGEREARDLITRGFAHEMLESLPIEALHEGIDPCLDAALSAATERCSE